MVNAQFSGSSVNRVVHNHNSTNKVLVLEQELVLVTRIYLTYKEQASFSTGLRPRQCGCGRSIVQKQKPTDI